MKCAVMVFLVCGALAGGRLCHAASTSKQENLQNCLDGFEECNRSLLTPAQAKQITELRHDQNLWGCLSIYTDCNHSLLRPEEVQEVSVETQRQNLLNCETTMGPCNKALLTPSQADLVAKITREQNLANCPSVGLWAWARHNEKACAAGV
jgi:hypothetical protein